MKMRKSNTLAFCEDTLSSFSIPIVWVQRRSTEALSECVKFVVGFLAMLCVDQALGADHSKEQSCNAQYFIS